MYQICMDHHFYSFQKFGHIITTESETTLFIFHLFFFLSLKLEQDVSREAI